MFGYNSESNTTYSTLQNYLQKNNYNTCDPNQLNQSTQPGKLSIIFLFHVHI